MTSAIQTFCDALITDLQTNVTGLAASEAPNVYRYVPFVPEEGQAQPGRSLGVWPAPEFEAPQPFTTDAHMLAQTYVLAVWENAGTAGTRRVTDQAADVAFVELYEAVRDRLYESDNQLLGGNDLVWEASGRFPPVLGLARSFEFLIRVDRYKGFV